MCISYIPWHLHTWAIRDGVGVCRVEYIYHIDKKKYFRTLLCLRLFYWRDYSVRVRIHTDNLTPSSLQEDQTLTYCFPAPGDVLLLSPFCPPWSGPGSQAPAETCLVNTSLTSEANRAHTKEPNQHRAGTFWHWRGGQSNTWVSCKLKWQMFLKLWATCAERRDSGHGGSSKLSMFFRGLDVCMLSSENFISEFVPAVHLNKIKTIKLLYWRELSGKHKSGSNYQACC